MVVLSMSCSAYGIIGFNCTHPETTSVEFGLLPPAECPDFAQTKDERIAQIQLVQRSAYKDTMGYAAKIVRTFHLLPCNGYPTTNMMTQRVLSLRKSEVMNLHHTLRYSDEWLAKISGGTMILKPNGTAEKARNLAGWTHENSKYCLGKEVQLYGLTYPDTVLAATYQVQLRDGLLTIDMKNNRIRTFSGTTCIYTEGHCFDLVYGDIYWSTGEIDLKECNQDSFIVLYEGEALVRNYPATSVTTSKRIVTLQTKAMAFSLVLTDATMLCQQHGYNTEAPGLYIIELKQNIKYFKSTHLHTLDINMNIYNSVRFVFLERALGAQLSELNAHVMDKICDLERQTLASLQSLAAVSPLEFAFAWKKQAGYTAVQRGEVIHLVKCVPVEVQVRRTQHCYQELPVTYMNMTAFMNPRSHVLTMIGEELECSEVYPVKYNLQERWITFGPNAVESTPPEMLTTKVMQNKWHFKPVNIGTKGIYSYADIERQRSAILFPVEFNAITRTIASTAGGYHRSRGHLNLMGMINPVDLKKALSDYWKELNDTLQLLGSYSGLVLMIVTVYRALAYACGGGFQCAVLTKIFGRFWGCLGLLCPTGANLAILLGREELRRTGNQRATLQGIIREYRRQNHQENVEVGTNPSRAENEYPVYELQEMRNCQNRGERLPSAP